MNSEMIIGFHLPTEKPYGVFSNWYHAEFNIAGMHYVNSEQYMMYQKVMLANRTDLAKKIMAEENPSKVKDYAGKNYFTDFPKIKPIWDEISNSIVKIGIKAKFAQNPDLLEILLSTGNSLLAECSQSDRIWGIGIGLSRQSEWENVANWDGNGYLGRALMQIRDEFRAEIKLFGKVNTTDFKNAAPIDIWKMRAGYLLRIPKYYNAIHTYALTLQKGQTVNDFYFNRSLYEWDRAISGNLSSIPSVGFYEMKQEIYEISRRENG